MHKLKKKDKYIITLGTLCFANVLLGAEGEKTKQNIITLLNEILIDSVGMSSLPLIIIHFLFITS